MGFFRFLKRENKKEVPEQLDLPPAPPPLEGFDEHAFPDFSEFESSDLTENKEKFPDFDYDKIEKEDRAPSKEFSLPDFPSLTEFEEKESPAAESIKLSPNAPSTLTALKPQLMTSTAKSMLGLQQEAYPKEYPISKSPDDFGKAEGGLFKQEKRSYLEGNSGKTMYVRVEKFKVMLGTINIVRTDLRKSEDALKKLENIKNTKDKSLDRIRSSLDDLQKKLIFVDKTLFKGD